MDEEHLHHHHPHHPVPPAPPHPPPGPRPDTQVPREQLRPRTGPEEEREGAEEKQKNDICTFMYCRHICGEERYS